MSRNDDRHDIEVHSNLRMINSDLDANTREHIELRAAWERDLAAVKAAMTQGFEECEERDKTMRRLLVGLLVSIVLASVGAMFSVVILAGGGT